MESLRESWLVEDRWWTAEPLRRRYWELVGERGRNVVVFHDLAPAAGSSRAHSGRDGDVAVRRPHTPSCTATRPTRSWTGPRCRRSSPGARASSGYRALALTDHNSVSRLDGAGPGRRRARGEGDPRRRDRCRRRLARGRAAGRSVTSPCSCATSAAGATSAGSSRSPMPTPARASRRDLRRAARWTLQAVLDHAEGLVCLTGCAGAP